ncbi:MAG: hypothetical protein MPK08_04090 [Alphaproteobacteria bacterium]|nr:hypothetical protein [Alphaproteobacteria bacterium]MDA8004061.1 hypothetical protein [Alphaproteobacteria bacterium]
MPMLDLLIFDLSRQSETGLDGFAEIDAVHDRLRPGRFAVFYWTLDRRWCPSPPMEGELLRTLCGDMRDRGREKVEFFVNMGVRVFSRHDLEAGEEIFVMVFRKSGEALRGRRGESVSLARKSRLDTLDSAFTRDIANNVWHIYRKDGVQKQLVTRFVRLLTWHDEQVGIWNGVRWRSIGSAQMEINSSLVPVPQKYDYDFAGNGASRGSARRLI